MGDLKILGFQNPAFKILADFKVLAFQNPEFKILADFKILAFPYPDFKILADLKVLAFQNPEFKILTDFEILALQKPEFKILAFQNPEFKISHAGAKPPLKSVIRAFPKKFQYGGQNARKGFWSEFLRSPPPDQPRKISPCEDWVPRREKWRANSCFREDKLCFDM